MRFFPLHAADFYKPSHRAQYPKGTEVVYSNFTARSDRLFNVPDCDIYDHKIVIMGIQFFIKDFLIDAWNEEFFSKPKHQVIARYKRRMDLALGEGSIAIDHVEALHDLGYLPICIKALPEGTLCPIGVPFMVIYNTDKKFSWLTNYLETILSNYIWKPITVATIAHCYKKLFLKYGIDPEFAKYQGHDFSFRGMCGPQDAAICGAAHFLSFQGTDSILSLDLLEEYYGATDSELSYVSVPASEHSVMCMGGKESELETYERFITEIYPSGIVSIVSDTYDFFKVITEYMTILKDKIMARNGKVVLRPDSGDPVKIICGDPDAEIGSAQYKGAVECLWDVFGGTVDDNGFKVLDSHIGLIYGDSITLERAYQILDGLKWKGFYPNVIFGIGSYTYQHITRDTLGMAVKATYGEVNGEKRAIFKDPITGDGVKKSAKGLLSVIKENGTLVLKQEQSTINTDNDELKEVFRDGKLLTDYSLSDIRDRISNQI